jgi:GDP-4-dehydro-6-deoxy-D-mannose reductase
MQDVLDEILSFSSRGAKASLNEKKVVEIGIPYAVGSNEKFRRATGWKPEIEFRQTLGDLVGWWKEKLGG